MLAQKITLPDDFQPVSGAVTSTCISVSLLRIKTAYIPFPCTKQKQLDKQKKLNSILNMPQIKYQRVQQVYIVFIIRFFNPRRLRDQFLVHFKNPPPYDPKKCRFFDFFFDFWEV